MLCKLTDSSEVLSALCIAKNAWGIYVSHCAFEIAPHNELNRAIPFLSEEDVIQLWHKGYMYLFFSSKEELDNHYNQIVGDEGPTELNDYDGEARVYALTCNPDGNSMNENT